MSSNQRKQRAFDDNGAGVIDYRAWLYEARGRIRTWEWLEYQDATLIVRPTPWHALSGGIREDERPAIREEIARLTESERAAWELSVRGFKFRHVTISGVPVGELVAMQRQGFTPVEGTKHTVLRNGLSVEVWDVEGEQPEKQGLSYHEIAARMDVPFWQAKDWVYAAREKLRGLSRRAEESARAIGHGAWCRCRGCADERRAAEVDAVIPQSWKESGR